MMPRFHQRYGAGHVSDGEVVAVSFQDFLVNLLLCFMMMLSAGTAALPIAAVKRSNQGQAAEQPSLVVHINSDGSLGLGRTNVIDFTQLANALARTTATTGTVLVVASPDTSAAKLHEVMALVRTNGHFKSAFAVAQQTSTH